MLRFLALLFLLVPSVAKSQEMSKEDMIMEFADIATLVAAEAHQCGETNKDRVIAFNKMFDSFMLYTAGQEGVELSQQDIEGYKLAVLIEQYEGMKAAYPQQGCYGINFIISMFDEKMKYAESVYDYYTPLDAL